MFKYSKKSSKEDDCSRNRKNFCKKYIPITNWFPKYTKFQAFSDVIAGSTIGLTVIPQSIAYAALAGLSAQYGLYSSFLGGFIYIFLGNIKEVSIGPTSLMSLLILEFTREMPANFAILLGFLAGCVELAMGLLNLGFLVDFISIPVTSGFTSATSVIIIIGQIQRLLGIKYKSKNILDNMIKLFQNIHQIRLNDTLLGLSSIIILLMIRKMKDIEFKTKDSGKNKFFKKAFWFFAISRNALIVLITTFITYHLHAAGYQPFILSGTVKSGLPPIQLPPFSAQVGNQTYSFVDMCSHLGLGIIFVPLIAVLTNVAIAKSYACGEAVDASHEMRTLGVCNILGSFVSSMPTCGAFTRSAVSNASGVQTPMAGLYSGAMCLMALSFLTPYFYFIPQSTLAAVLIAAIVFLIDYQIVIVLWKGNRRDAYATIGTFIISIIFNVETGLILGSLCNMIYLLYLSARPKITVTECKTNLGDKYLLIKPEAGLFYPAVDFLTTKISELRENQSNNGIPFIIDCHRLKGFDYTSVKGMERLLREFKTLNQQLWFLNVNASIMKAIGYFGEIESFHVIQSEENIVECFQNKQKISELSVSIPLISKTIIQEENSDIATDNYLSSNIKPHIEENDIESSHL
ncbi:sodium-independent sulfate anion transporter-like [Leptopilina boulardi]|uniref:sodium-independent sulfate anion transporter-like n=1 Tax=Leptopilina boulardi TaxID=63433 RepID=UPI0021F65685|nr:sodium-independent sulfate anion transporter-like [Leptopilina boulardi]